MISQIRRISKKKPPPKRGAYPEKNPFIIRFPNPGTTTGRVAKREGGIADNITLDKIKLW